MRTRYDEVREAVKTPSRVLIEEYRKIFRDDTLDGSLAVIHYRGTQVEFDLGLEYVKSTDADDRAVGADILSQLGWSDKTFLKESVDALIPLLGDVDPHVIYSAAHALGHRNDPRAIPELIPLARHPSALIRYGVVHGLTGYEDSDAVSTMIELTTDEDLDVRNWALFGIGTQIDLDTPSIREALMVGLSERDMEARGESLVGLARRGDERVIHALLKEWYEEDMVSILSVEAAGEIADARLLPFLEEFEATHDLSENESAHQELLAAIEACRNGIRTHLEI